MTDYFLCGLHVRSGMDLPELLPWTGGDGEPDVHITLGSVPDHLDGAHSAGPLIEVAPDRTCRLEVGRVARYLVSGGHRIVIQPAEPIDEAAVRAFLLGTAFAMLFHQRGLFPFHASSVRIGGSCVVLAGPSGVGKSTLAAALVKAGAALIADDVTVIDFSPAAAPIVRPSYPQMKLWRNSLTGLGIESAGLRSVRRGFEKFALPAVQSFAPDPLPLAAVYLLQNIGGMRPVPIERLSGIGAIRELADNFYRPRLVEAMDRSRDVAQAAVKILAKAEVCRLPVVRSFDAIQNIAADVIARHAGAAR